MIMLIRCGIQQERRSGVRIGLKKPLAGRNPALTTSAAFFFGRSKRQGALAISNPAEPKIGDLEILALTHRLSTKSHFKGERVPMPPQGFKRERGGSIPERIKK